MSLCAIRLNLPKLLKTSFNRLFHGLFAWTLLSAIALPLRLDSWPPAVFLTYLPRPLYIALGLGFALIFGVQKRYLKLGIAVCAIALCIHSLGWGNRGAIAKASSPMASRLTLLSMNIHEQAEQVRDLMDEEGVEPDILCLQEVSYWPRQALIEALPNYQFYWGDRDLKQSPTEAFPLSSIIGLRKSSFETDSVEITPAITSYRTFAINAQLKAQQEISTDEIEIELAQQPKEIAIANVHTTKALVFHAGLKGFITQTPTKAVRHINERQQLEAWAAEQTMPVIAAGDFNAPTGSVGARLAGFHSSHSEAGKGPLLTFPSKLPLLGIDHIQGNAQVQFHSSLVLDADFSDHLPQIAYFSLQD